MLKSTTSPWWGRNMTLTSDYKKLRNLVLWGFQYATCYRCCQCSTCTRTHTVIFFPINIRNVPICVLYRLACYSHSTRDVLIKAPSFDNIFYISCRQRWNMVLNVLNQIKTAKNKKQNRKQGNYYSIKKIGEKKKVSFTLSRSYRIKHRETSMLLILLMYFREKYVLEHTFCMGWS